MRVHLLGNCLLLGTGSVLGQTSIAGIFLHQLEAIVCIILQISFATHAVLKIWDYHTNIPQF